MKGYPMMGKTHRIPDMVGRIGPDGKFNTKLLAGNYYMGVLVITDPGRGPGPPRPGETFYFIRDDKGSLKNVSVADEEIKDLGQITGAKAETFAAYKNIVPVPGAQREQLQGTLGFGGQESGEGEAKPAEAEKAK